MLPLLHSHRSIRAFKPDPLPRDIVEAVGTGDRAGDGLRGEQQIGPEAGVRT